MDQAAHWDERYRIGDIPWHSGRPEPELMRFIAEEKIQPCPALELGCGFGTNSIWLAQQGFEVTALDISSVAIQRARDIASKVAVRFLVADILNPPRIAETFPFFFDRGCYHAVRRDDVTGYLLNLDKLTTPDAIGLVLAGNAKDPNAGQGPPVVTEEQIRDELGRVFEIVRLQEFHFDPPPGSSENWLGWSCLVRKRAKA